MHICVFPVLPTVKVCDPSGSHRRFGPTVTVPSDRGHDDSWIVCFRRCSGMHSIARNGRFFATRLLVLPLHAKTMVPRLGALAERVIFGVAIDPDQCRNLSNRPIYVPNLQQKTTLPNRRSHALHCAIRGRAKPLDRRQFPTGKGRHRREPRPIVQRVQHRLALPCVCLDRLQAVEFV